MVCLPGAVRFPNPLYENLTMPGLAREFWQHTYDKKSDEGSNSVRMRPENSGALKVVEN